jgi:hypothetical protein
MIMVLIPAVRAFPQLLVEPKEALVGDQALLGVVGKRELPQLRALGEGFHEAVADERDERNINALKHLFVGVKKFDQRSLAEIHASGHFEPSQSCAALVQVLEGNALEALAGVEAQAGQQATPLADAVDGCISE